MTSGPGLRILLVEDNPIDVKVTIRAMRKLRLVNEVEVVSDGDAALDYLRRPASVGPRPDLVLLDLNLPGKDGHDVLAAIRNDAVLSRIPVVVLTTSTAELDVVRAYDAGANAYVAKPDSVNGWLDVVARIEAFWATVVRVPSSGEPNHPATRND